MPVSAGVFEQDLLTMDKQTFVAYSNDIPYYHWIDADSEDVASDINIKEYNEENPYYCYYRINVFLDYNPDDLYKETGILTDVVCNLQYLNIPNEKVHSVRWAGSGLGGSQIEHGIRYTDQVHGANVNSWTRYSYGYGSVDEVFVKMWYDRDNRSVEYMLYVWSYEAGLVKRRESVPVVSAPPYPQVKVVHQACNVEISYAFGKEAQVYYALANLDELLDDSYNQGYKVGEDEGYTSGYQEGYTAGETLGNANSAAAREEGYDTGYAEGFAEGSVANLQDFADYVKQQGVTFTDQISYGTLYKAIRDKGWTDSVDQGTLTTKLIFTALEAPVNVILGSLNFEVFGINFAAVTFAILAAVIVLFILRVVIDIIV